MKIIQEDNFADIMKDEVEPYLYAHCRECYITGAKEPERREKNGKLHVKFYETDRPKGVIIISHGFTEGAQKYDEMIYYFLKAGYLSLIHIIIGWISASVHLPAISLCPRKEKRLMLSCI